ncbi:MAG TPA: Holliday junction branch migration protein RuvA [Patescibacteria group bacterium]|nr:Holliday junction branch migration protein RuvA [Patescibacteria group bacterium]
MIGYLKGTIIHKSTNTLTLNVNGVGYEILTTETLALESKIGTMCEIFIHTAVKETAIDLYGFSAQPTRALFRGLLCVSGIGPKSALGILNKTSAEALVVAIQSKNSALIAGKKIGTKTAEKIIAALHGKISGYADVKTYPETAKHQDLVDALASLGYNQAQISSALSKIPKDAATTEDQIKEALKIFQR